MFICCFRYFQSDGRRSWRPKDIHSKQIWFWVRFSFRSSHTISFANLTNTQWSDSFAVILALFFGNFRTPTTSISNCKQRFQIANQDANNNGIILENLCISWEFIELFYFFFFFNVNNFNLFMSGAKSYLCWLQRLSKLLFIIPREKSVFRYDSIKEYRFMAIFFLFHFKWRKSFLFEISAESLPVKKSHSTHFIWHHKKMATVKNKRVGEKMKIKSIDAK